MLYQCPSIKPHSIKAKATKSWVWQHEQRTLKYNHHWLSLRQSGQFLQPHQFLEFPLTKSHHHTLWSISNCIFWKLNKIKMISRNWERGEQERKRMLEREREKNRWKMIKKMRWNDFWFVWGTKIKFRMICKWILKGWWKRRRRITATTHKNKNDKIKNTKKNHNN